MTRVSKTGKAIAGGGLGLAFFAIFAAPAYVFIPEAWATNFYYVLGSALFVALLAGVGLSMVLFGLKQKVKQSQPEGNAA